MKRRNLGLGLILVGLLGCDEGKEAPAPEPLDGNAPAYQADAEDKLEGRAEWVSMVPEEGMGSWTSVAYGGEGEVAWSGGVLRMEWGAMLTGVRWEGDLPQLPYEIELEARKTLGEDFFCGLTVPVGGVGDCVTLIVGGWGGEVVGISSIDELDASENETSTSREFEKDRWYRIRMVVRAGRLAAWVDGEPVVDVATEGRKLGLRAGGIEESAPLGVSSFQTTTELRGIRWRSLR